MKKLLTCSLAGLFALTAFTAISCSTSGSDTTIQVPAKVETVNLALSGLH